jgi:RTX calcium-binding nonapeptide repeat (4 copies)
VTAVRRAAVTGAVLVVPVLAAFPGAVPAPAATIAVATDHPAVGFVAEPGEVNDVLLEEDPSNGDLLVTDAGAPLTPGAGCEAIGAHAARCTWTPGVGWPPAIRVTLGDGDDAFHVAPAEHRLVSVRGSLAVDGNGGDDLIDTRHAAETYLDGGPGRDELRSGAIGGLLDGGPGTDPDVLIGGPREDMVTYAGRQQPVDVNLFDPGPDGAAGEQDIIRDVEGIIGASKTDRLTGDAGDNVFYGGRGRDVIRGFGGNDRVNAGPPLELPRRLTGTARGDKVTCGAGADLVSGRRTTDFTPRSCEHVVVRRAIPARLGGSAPVTLAAYPKGRKVVFPCLSKELAGDPGFADLHCRGHVTLRDRRHRLLAKAQFNRGHRKLKARLKFTARGRRATACRGDVRARVRFHGHNMPADGWTIRLGR